MPILGKINSPAPRLVENDSFAKAFEYLKKFLLEKSPERKRLLAISAGEQERVELGDGIFAIEHAYITKERAEGRFESHRKYIDIQAIIKGEELVQVAPIAGLAVDLPYDADSDVVFYHDTDEKRDSVLTEGMFAVFYPEDGHKPSLTNEKPVLVHKTVVKIPVGEKTGSASV